MGEVSEDELADLLSLSELPLGAFDGETLLGFVLCLIPGTRYGSPNYAWFNQRYTRFFYVDRVAVGEAYRDGGVGTKLYSKVIAEAHQRQVPIAAEVSLRPPNLGSMRFHGRHEFIEVGTLEHGDKSVTMLLRQAE